MKNLKTPKLSRRLQTILDFTPACEHFYDMCADHGKLGFAVSNQTDIKNIHFVDPVKGIINKLDEKILKQTNPSHFRTYQSNAQDIFIKSHAVVSIAGVGVDLGLEILNKLYLFDKTVFILNLNGAPFKTRKFLNENGLVVIDEDLVLENGKYYEILKVVKGSIDSYSMIGGEKIWAKGELSSTYKTYLLDYLSIKLKFTADKYLELLEKKLKDKRI